MGFLFKWTFRAAVFALIAAALNSCGSTEHYTDEAAAPTQPAASASLASALGGEPSSELEQMLVALEQPASTLWAEQCAAALPGLKEQAAQGVWNDAQESDCMHAIASLPMAEGRALQSELRASGATDLALMYALEDAARGSGPAYAELARQYAARAGDASLGYAALEHDVLTMAIAAAERAARSGSSVDLAYLEELRDLEFPFTGTREEKLWRSLYFRDFETIDDTLPTRRAVGAAASSIATLCATWEPPGIRSVGFDTGLEAYIAPVRAEVPGRIVDMLPRLRDTIVERVNASSQGASDRSFSGWLQEIMTGYQSARRDVLNSVAVGSAVGRDAAQVLFNEATSCRRPRGLKFIQSLTMYFEYAKDRIPRDASTTRASSTRKTKEQS